MFTNKNSKGIAALWLIVFGFILIAGSGYWFWVNDIKPKYIPNLKGCDIVFGRDNYAKNIQTNECKKFQTYCDILDGWVWVQACDNPTDISTWETYRNEKYGFEVRYQRDLHVESMAIADDEVIIAYHIFDSNYKAPEGAVGADVRDEKREIYFEIKPYSIDNLKKLNDYVAKNLAEQREKEIPNNPLFASSASGNITINFLWSGLIGQYTQAIVHNDKYIITFTAYSHEDLFRQILSTFRFLK